ncbi:MAG: (deoxy)nucleoside triphosphate pyrophosphohydrolase [Deltaproteobacteria bacterium]|nr:(deoxy)nucleoside triphosphate pyrophosphohydrolase [Deltaproteobacteria bacterium]
MEKSIRVVSAVILRDGAYLITQRREEAKHSLMWEFPGGRVEQGESDADALKREFSERLGAEVQIGKPVAFRRHSYEGYSVELLLYEAELISNVAALESLKVHDFRWVPAEEFANYPFPDADTHALDDFKLMAGNGRHDKKPPQA